MFSGNRHTISCLKPAVLGVESSLELAVKQKKRVVWRLDGGGGSDKNLNWLLARSYQVVAKGKSNRRACALARQVKRWDVKNDIWLAEVPPPVEFAQPVRFFVKKRLKKGKFCYSYYVSSLTLPSKPLFMACYDHRGGAEVEQFRNDKGGLSLAHRRKRSFYAQKSLILLTDIAHNLLTHFRHNALANTKFANYGPKRIVRDLFHIPGRFIFDNGQLKKIEFCNSNEFSQDLIICFNKYFFGD